MRFRPCIDIHDGRVKQMVGGTLNDTGGTENYISDQMASWYASLYRQDRLSGGHVILLNPPGSPFAKDNIRQATEALAAFPGGLQLGGGVTAENAGFWLDQGASHVIVTSYIFHDGILDQERLFKLISAVGKSRLVLDLSCRKMDGHYWIVTNRWQLFTKLSLTLSTLSDLAEYCNEFLIHAVDVEGRSAGIDRELVDLLGGWNQLPVTYAGGVRDMEDIRLLEQLGKGRLDFTVGSALDLFGGPLRYQDLIQWQKHR